MLQKILKYLLVGLLVLNVLMVASCTLPPDDYQRIDPENPPDPSTYGFVQKDTNSQPFITCKVTLQTKLDQQVFDEASYLVTFAADSYYGQWYAQWTDAQEAYRRSVLPRADAQLRSGLGISSQLWNAGAEENEYILGLVHESGTIEDPVPNTSSPACPSNWTVTYTLKPMTHDPVQWSNDTPNTWKLGVSVPNNGVDAYFTISSGAGHVEFPLRYNEFLAIMNGTFDPVAAQQDITFEDAASTLDRESYEQQIWDATTRVKNSGDIVARFSWTTIESQELALNFAARQLLLKAFMSNDLRHFPAFFGDVETKPIAVTNLSVQSDPIAGAFAFGFGAVSGGGGSTEFTQTVTSLRVFDGDVYILNSK